MKLYGPASRLLLKLILDIAEEINKEKVKTILDIGCGHGQNTFHIAKVFPNSEVSGIDFSKSAIEGADRKFHLPNLEFLHDIDSDMLKLKFDLICCFEVLEHVENWKQFLKKISDSSNKYIMLSFPTGRMRKFESNIGHLRNFKKGEVENQLHKLSFKPLIVYYAGFPFYSPVYREVCNITNAGDNPFTSGKYGIRQKLIATSLYILFILFSTKKKFGDKFCALFERETPLIPSSDHL